MSASVYTPTLKVTVAGVDVSPYVAEAHVSLGVDLMTSEATIHFTQSIGVNPYDLVYVSAGLTEVNGQVLRFGGYAVLPEDTNWVYTEQLSAKGPLYMCDLVVAPDDIWADELAVQQAFAWAQPWNPPGVDLSNAGAGQLDTDIISYLITQSNMQSWMGVLGGNNNILGTKAWDQFVWRRGQSARQMISDIDDPSLGMVTYESLGGSILRSQIWYVGPTGGTNQYTLSESAGDILDGSTASVNTKDVANRVVVTGWDPGDGQNVAVYVGASQGLPPNQTYVSLYKQSPYIENRVGPTGVVLTPQPYDCTSTAYWWWSEHSAPILDVTINTWRDDGFWPTAYVGVTSAHLLNPSVNQGMRIRHIDIDVVAGGGNVEFTQTLALRWVYAPYAPSLPVLGDALPLVTGQAY